LREIKTFCSFLSDTFLPSRVTVKSTFKPCSVFELKSIFLSLHVYTLREINSAIFKLPYQSSSVAASRSYNKPRRDFDLKQRSPLAYYNKGSARFITTKVFFCTRYFSKTKSNPAKKNFRAMFLRRNKALMPKFRPFCHNFFFHPNRHLAWFCTHPFNWFCINTLHNLQVLLNRVTK